MASINAKFIEAELTWLRAIIDWRLGNHFAADDEKTRAKPKAPSLKVKSDYPTMLKNTQLDDEVSRIALALSIAPHVKPELLEAFYIPDVRYNKAVTEFGGASAQQHKGFIPTWQTFFFLMAGNDIPARIELERTFLFDNHQCFSTRLLVYGSVEREEPLSSMSMLPSPVLLAKYVYGQESYRPVFSAYFPAEHFSTKMSWKDLILPGSTLESLSELSEWIEVESGRQSNSRFLEPGLKVLLFGPPGTGKSLAAALLGKRIGRDVYRVDISKVTSKYIGETQKNLASVFEEGERGNWILFFDEADALFGKRTKVDDHKDRYGNQEVAYLLQRIEHYPGIIIMAANQISSMDKAFSRRFSFMVPFQNPRYAERLKLWQTYFEEILKAEEYEQLAKDYTLTGGNIKNVLRTSLLMAGNNKPNKEQIELAIEKELQKEKLL